MRHIQGQEYVNEIPSMWRGLANKPYHRGYATTKITKTKYGFKINRFSHYVSLQSIKFEVFDDGFSKGVVKVNKNYQAPYQYTIYFDNKMQPITSQSDNVREELKEWKKLRGL